MKLSLNWLSRYVDLSGHEATEIAHDLTLSTAEIEGVEQFAEVLDNVVCAEVVTCVPHPDSDHLSLCQVADGGPETIAVVCGAPNVAAGQKIVFARVGTVLPGGLKLKKTKIRGQQSLGMIVSERELELSDEHEGIMVLDPSAKVGAPASEVIPARDTVLEIDNKSITHRPDLWGHYGFARELSAIYGLELAPVVTPGEFPTTGIEVPIEIADTQLCSRYLGLVMAGLKVGKAPAWMRYLLAAVGQRPISNVVDLTNFILLDLGQPLHAFDYDKLRGPEIKVRNARDGECMNTLDGEERRLTTADLLITDQGGPVALAGVMGGLESEINDQTSRIFLESANFDASTIRRTSSRLGLRSESSARFEKSLDPTLAWTAVEKFSAMLLEMCPDLQIAGPVNDAGGWTFPGRTVGLRRERVATKLGVKIEDKRIAQILSSLHFSLTNDEQGWQVSVPSFRATKDISIEDDLIEEIGRIYRYGNIPPSPQMAPVRVPWRDPELVLERQLRTILAFELRLREACNYTFITDELMQALGLEAEQHLRVLNPVADNMAHLRRHVLPGLLGSLTLNLRHRQRVGLFELGKGYLPETRDERNQPAETREIAAMVAARTDQPILPELKGMIEHLADRLDLTDFHFNTVEGNELPSFFHPVESLAVLAGDTRIGLVGEIHPQKQEALQAEGRCGFFTLDVRALLGATRDEHTYRPLPQYPPIRVDIAVIVDEEKRVGEVLETVRTAGKKQVAGVELFDIFRGKSVGEGRKSLAFHVTLQAADRTLGDQDEKKFLDRVRRILPQIGAEIRG